MNKKSNSNASNKSMFCRSSQDAKSSDSLRKINFEPNKIIKPNEAHLAFINQYRSNNHYANGLQQQQQERPPVPKKKTDYSQSLNSKINSNQHQCHYNSMQIANKKPKNNSECDYIKESLTKQYYLKHSDYYHQNEENDYSENQMYKNSNKSKLQYQ